MQVREAVLGFKERRGPNTTVQSYPLDSSLGYFFDQPRFERNFFSSGVLLAHPALDEDGVDRHMLAEILFEAFLIEVPFERQDVRFGADQFRISRSSLTEGQRFICIYDQAYGSLCLTSRLMEPRLLRAVLDKALDIAVNDATYTEVITENTRAALLTLIENATATPIVEQILKQPTLPPGNCTRVILPGSVGLYPDYNNEEYAVESVFFSPNGLMYRGRRISCNGKQFAGVNMSAPVDKIILIEGRSECGFYDYDTGEIKNSLGECESL
jgi:DEAD/DEAH box helicase domain-containing protein